MTCILRKTARAESDKRRWEIIFEVDRGECATTTSEIGADRKSNMYAVKLSSTWGSKGSGLTIP